MPKKSEHTLKEEINLNEIRLRGGATINPTLLTAINTTASDKANDII